VDRRGSHRRRSPRRHSGSAAALRWRRSAPDSRWPSQT